MSKCQTRQQQPHQSQSKISPADGFGLKVARVASVYDYDLVVFVQKTLHGRLGRPCDVTPEASAVAGPPEGIALAVLFGEHQEDLKRQRGVGRLSGMVML